MTYKRFCLISWSKNIPVLLTKTDEFPEAGFDAIKKINPKKIIIIGGEKAVGRGGEERLLSYTVVDRIWGETRVETSIEIAKTIKPDKVIITNYDSNIEAAVSSYLYNAPIIYVNSEKLDIVLEFLKTYKPKVLFIDVDESTKKRIKEGI